MASRPALFLDRDGVVNVDTDFAFRPEDIIFQEGIFALVRLALDCGFTPVVVTNQSGIARGYFSEEAFKHLTAWMLEAFAAAGAPLAHIYHCPFHPQAQVAAFRHPDHPWRKPRPGMLLAASAELGLDLPKSLMIGDRWSDAQAAHAAGLTAIALIGDRADQEGAVGPCPPVDRLQTVQDSIGWFKLRTGATDRA